MAHNAPSVPLLPFFLASWNMLFVRKGHQNAVLGEAYQLRKMQHEPQRVMAPAGRL